MVFHSLAVSTNGTLAFLPGSGSRQDHLVRVDLEGEETPLLGSERYYLHPRYSPSGESLADTVFGPEGADIWVVNLSTGVESQLTRGGGHLVSIWTPSEERLIFSKETMEPPASVSLYWQRKDGSTPAEPLLLAEEAGERLWPYDLSPDGTRLVFGKARVFELGRAQQIWLLDLDSGETRVWLTEERALFMGASVSPDGRWLAYAKRSSGLPQIYVQGFPGGGERHQLSTQGGLKPLWSNDGSKLYFLDNSTFRMMVVPVATKPDFRGGSPELLLEERYALGPYTSHPNFDLSPDGTHFVMVKEGKGSALPTEIRVVTDWFEELKRLTPLPVD